MWVFGHRIIRLRLSAKWTDFICLENSKVVFFIDSNPGLFHLYEMRKYFVHCCIWNWQYRTNCLLLLLFWHVPNHHHPHCNWVSLPLPPPTTATPSSSPSYITSSILWWSARRPYLLFNKTPSSLMIFHYHFCPPNHYSCQPTSSAPTQYPNLAQLSKRQLFSSPTIHKPSPMSPLLLCISVPRFFNASWCCACQQIGRFPPSFFHIFASLTIYTHSTHSFVDFHSITYFFIVSSPPPSHKSVMP